MPLIMFVSSSFNTYVNLPKKKKKRRLRVSNIYAHNAFVMLDKEREPERFAKVYKETNEECEE